MGGWGLAFTAKLTIASIWRENMLGYLSADIICSEKRVVFRVSESVQIFFSTHAILKIGNI